MSPPFNLVHLKFFCDAVADNSITVAAKKNGVSQSSVSQAIAKLEEKLGVNLILRSRPKFQTTQEGKILFEEARNIFRTMDDIHLKLQQRQEELRGTLRFACTNSLAMSFLAPSYKNIRDKLPYIEIGMGLGNLEFIQKSLINKEIEFAIVVVDSTFEKFMQYPLYKGRFHLYQHIDATHQLIEKGILVDSKHGTYVKELQAYFTHFKKASLEIQTELAGWEVVARFTEKNIGVGFFPDYLMSNNRYPYIKKCPLEIPEFGYTISAIYREGTSLSREARAFLEQFALE